jgi:riboflavin synthase
MFTGIIETTGRIMDTISAGTNTTFWVSSPVSNQLKVDQSVAHSGVCLTVEEVVQDRHRVTAIAETLQKTNLQQWKTGDLVNIERCLPLNGRLDGHLVQGHVDATGTCLERKEVNGSHEFRFRFPDAFAALIIEKGSISLNGISLTVFNVTRDGFSVAIIPYTFDYTNIKDIFPGHAVNLEFDLIGKYVNRITGLRS